MKVLFLTKWYPVRNKPQNGNFIRKHAQAVSLLCDVYVLFACPSDTINSVETVQNKEKNFSELIIYYPCVKSRIKIISGFLKLVKYFYYTFKGISIIFNENGKPDIVHVNILTRPGIVAYFLKIFYKIPYIITEHWTGYLQENLKYKGFLKIFLSRFIVKNASALTAVSQSLKKAMENCGLKHKIFEIIPNVVDTELFVPSEIQNLSEIKKIIHISNFKDRHKNVSGILRTIAKVSQIRQDFRLHIIGSSNQIHEFEQFAQNLELFNKFVFFEGLKEPEEVAEILKNSSFLLMFSNFETFLIPLAESLSCGIPVIFTECGTCLDSLENSLENSFGKKVQPSNENELFNAIFYMLDNYKTFDRKKLREFSEKNFEIQNVAKKVLDLYNQILKNG